MRAKSRCLLESLECRRMFVVTMFTIDQAQSSLQLSGTLEDTANPGAQPLANLQPSGGLVDYTGDLTVDVDLNNSTLDFQASSLVPDTAAGPFQPNNLAANYAYDLTLGGDLISQAIRNLQLELTGNVATSNGDFDSSQLVPAALNGDLDSDWTNGAGLDQGALTSATWSMGTPSGTASIASLPGGELELTIPLALIAQLTVHGTVVANLQFNGTIVAVSDTAPPTGGSISGTVIDDQNDNGVADGGEPGLEGWTVFLDTNTNGTLDGGETSTVTDVNGGYSFIGLTAGTYTVATVVMTGWEPGGATTGTTTAVVTDGNVTTATPLLFFQVTPSGGAVNGLVINDQNDSGTVDGGEPGLAGWTVFIDDNSNNTLDGGETSTVTAGNGAYSFPGLADGSYNIAVVVMPGWTPGGATTGTTTAIVAGGNVTIATTLLFFQTPTVGTISGVVANDQNDDGIRQGGEPGLNGWTVYIDADNDATLDAGETSTITAGGGLYTFSNLAPGTYNIRAVVQQGWRPGGLTTGVVTVVVTAGSTTTPSPLLFTQIAGMTGLVFNDVNENGVQDAGEFGLSGWTVYIDTDKDGVLDFGEPTSITDVSGGFSFESLAPGGYVVRVNLFSGWRLVSPSNNINPVKLDPSEEETGVIFAVTQTSSISGVVFDDANDNARRDSTELNKGLEGWTVYIDSNLNGTFDGGETSTLTDENGKFKITGLGSGNYRVGMVVPSGWRQTLPSGGFFEQSVTAPNPANSLLLGATTSVRLFGTVSSDINDNGKREQSEPRLPGFNVFIDRNSNGRRDAGETIAQSDANGNWIFTGIPAGTYKLGIISQPNWRRNGPKIVTMKLGSGGVGTSIPWRMTQRVRIFGSVFADLNKSQKRDENEAGVPGVLVFLDKNGNNKWDADEKARITDANGDYRFTNLKRGEYRIRMEAPSGASVTRIFNATLKHGELAERHLGLFSTDPIV